MSIIKKEEILNKQTLRTMIMIVAGCAVYALGFNMFFQPNNIVMGGFTGLAQIINRLIPVLPVGMLTIVMNIPLFIIGVKKQGLKLLINSLIAMSLGSVMIDGLAMVVTFPAMDPLLATIYGGVFVGASCGLMLAGALGFVEANGGNQTLEVATNMRWLAAGAYCVSGLIMFIGLALVYNLDKKTLAQMTEELSKRNKK